MENGERRTNYEQRHAAWGQCTTFSLTSKDSYRTRNGDAAAWDSAPLLPFHRKIRELRVMENHHDGSYHHWLPGSGVLNKHGDAEA